MPKYKQRQIQRHKPPPLDLPDNPAKHQLEKRSKDGKSLSELSRSEQSQVAKPRVHFDWQDWLPYLEEYDCTQAQKRELIETYWLIILAFIDLDYEVGSFEEETNVDKSTPRLDLSAALRTAVLQSENTETQPDQPEKEKNEEETI